MPFSKVYNEKWSKSLCQNLTGYSDNLTCHVGWFQRLKEKKEHLAAIFSQFFSIYIT